MKHILLTLSIVLALTFYSHQMNAIELIRNDAEKRVDVRINNILFTSYLYSDKFEKPVLYPVNAPNGTEITRGYPIHPEPGERVDHPHHYGIWFNHGNVNGLDFWNNSPFIAPEKKHLYGTIRHKEILSIEQEKESHGAKFARLITKSSWENIDKKVLINEQTEYAFVDYQGIWGIIRTTRLTADKDSVVFGDSKEGLFALRFCREFEDCDDIPKKLLNKDLIPVDTIITDNSIASGIYRNDIGQEKADVWGKPASWISLSGIKNGEKISMAIMDNRQNPGYPAHSHARGYGLFGINNLGSSHYNTDYPEVRYVLKPGETVTFKHLFIISVKDQFNDQELNDLFYYFNYM